MNANNTVFRKMQVELTGKAIGSRTGMVVSVVAAHNLKTSAPLGQMLPLTIWIMLSQILIDYPRSKDERR